MLCYVDDVLVGFVHHAKHVSMLRAILRGLENFGWTFNEQKGQWAFKEVEFLG